MIPPGKPPATKTAKPGGGRRAASGTAPGTDGSDEVCTLRIELLETDPVIWREAEVPTSVTLEDLHAIIQATMAWEDYHLWEFTVGKQRYGPPAEDDWGMEPAMDASKVRLRDVLKPRRTTIDYLYDFGDSWAHRLTVTRIRPGEPGVGYPRYTGGERAAPPEDSGGIYGFYDKLDALANSGHPDHEEIAEWLDGYDPDTVDEETIKLALGAMAKARTTGGKRRRKPDA